jgi:hypothetical protein
VRFLSGEQNLVNTPTNTDSNATMRESDRWQIPTLIVLSTFWESLFIWKGSNLLDEGWALYAGMQLGMGRHLYDEISWVFPPGHALPAWVGHGLDPQGVLVPRIIYAAFTVALCVSLYYLGRKFMPSRFAFLGAALLAVAAPRSHMMHLLYGYRYMVFAVAVLLVYAKRLETGQRSWMFVAGLLAGVSLYFRVTPAFAVSVGLGVAVLTQEGGWRSWFEDWLLYAAGLLLVIGPVLGYFATTVGVARVFQEVILHPVAMLQPLAVPELMLPDWSSRTEIAEAWRVLSLRLYLVLYVGFAISLVMSFGRARLQKRPFESTLLVATVIWGSVFFLRSFGRADEAHMDTTLPPICLLIALFVSRAFNGIEHRFSEPRAARMAAPITVGLVFLAWVLLLASDRYPLPHRFERTGLSFKVTSGVALIEKFTRPGDIILDLSTAPMFHALTGRPGPGHSDIIMPGTFVKESDQAAFLRRLEATPPAVVLWPVQHFDQMESRSARAVAPEVVDWVEARYRPGETTHKFQLWLPRPKR